MEHTLKVTYGTSRGADTYGYTVVSLRENGQLKARCKGGGYDMRGTVFGDWLQNSYQDRLLSIKDQFQGEWTKDSGYRTFKDKGLYGGTYYPEGSSDNKKPHITLDGACGIESMRRIAEAVGLRVSRIDAGKNMDIFIVSDVQTESVAA